MKTFTHPPRTTTLVQIKDGSTARKEWLYFRPTFVLEGESKAWNNLRRLVASQREKTVLNPKPTTNSNLTWQHFLNFLRTTLNADQQKDVKKMFQLLKDLPKRKEL